jgi:hypothetical protein
LQAVVRNRQLLQLHEGLEMLDVSNLVEVQVEDPEVRECS